MQRTSRFLHTDLGNLNRGEVVEVSLSGNAANVLLLNSSNLSNYRSGRKYSYKGGLATKSPVRLPIPSSDHWHVVIDMRGLRGQTKSSVRVLPSPLPRIRNTPLSSIPSLVHDEAPSADRGSKEHDVFISHASEDKNDLVRPLADALQNKGLSVWYDEFTLRIGDSLRQKIDQGLSRSRVGLVVLSPSFITIVRTEQGESRQKSYPSTKVSLIEQKPLG
jgi:hypothetical protein